MSRRTFFRNFRSKEDVALTAVTHLRDVYLEVLDGIKKSGPLADVFLDGHNRLELRLLIEFFMAAWHCTLDELLPNRANCPHSCTGPARPVQPMARPSAQYVVSGS
ncbi:hypothetical protein ACIBJC_00655 [Streptomyces sp. NPDC050509]|uniref:hypothetical protein n=1 Tax=Streptomyces sp. NPDC050509 TaxID=3365620 RepID=UPI0037A2EDEE